MRFFFFLPLLFLLTCDQPTEVKQETILQESTHLIGTQRFYWEDSTREDPYYGENRLINVQLWYPVETSIDTTSPAYAGYYFEFDKVQDQLDYWTVEQSARWSSLTTSAILEAPIKKGDEPYPLLIFSPSLGGNLSFYTFYAEQLVKEGYVVVGINHLYESDYVLDEKQQVYPANHSFHDSLKTLKIPEQITAEQYREIKGERQRVLGKDMIFCLNELEKRKTSLFENQVDFSKIGVWGHSIGGAAAIYASLLDERIKAVLDIDGTPPSVALKLGLEVPFLFLEDLTDYRNHQGYQKLHQRRMAFCEKNLSDSYRVLIGGANHNSFLDVHLYTTKIKSEQQKAHKLLNQSCGYMATFFNHYLKKEPIALKAMQSDTLEVFFIDKTPNLSMKD